MPAAIFKQRRHASLPSASPLSLIISTYNVRSTHTARTADASRRGKTAAAMQALAAQSHISCFQELGIGSKDPAQTLHHLLDCPTGSTTLACSSRYGPGSGVGIFFSKHITQHYDIEQPPLHDVKDRAMCALLRPREGGSTSPRDAQ